MYFIWNTAGQNEIKELIKHTTTLMTENFTYIRKDLKTLAFNVNSDVELLFKEMADVKRKINKLEQNFLYNVSQQSVRTQIGPGIFCWLLLSYLVEW